MTTLISCEETAGRCGLGSRPFAITCQIKSQASIPFKLSDNFNFSKHFKAYYHLWGFFLFKGTEEQEETFFPEWTHCILAREPSFVNTLLEMHVQQSVELRTVPVGAGGQCLTRNVNWWSESPGQEPCQLLSYK